MLTEELIQQVRNTYPCSAYYRRVPKHQIDDVKQEVAAACLMGLKTHDETKGPLIPWLARYAAGMISKYMKYQQREASPNHRSLESVDIPAPVNPSVSDFVAPEDTELLLDYFSKRRKSSAKKHGFGTRQAYEQRCERLIRRYNVLYG